MRDEPEAKRPRYLRHELESLNKEELIHHVMKQYQYADSLEALNKETRDSSELVSLRESEEKLKQQQQEATRRENVLVMRLTTKEQEMQEYANQIQELRQAQVPGISQLRSTLLDPAVNLMFERMKKELDATKAKLEETQNDLSAWKFTPDSNTGKRLMAKCRLLYQENEELGKMISSGRIAKLEGDLALQRNFSEEMKKSQAEMDSLVMELDGDMEGLQSTIYYLQQQLRDSKEINIKLKQEKDNLRETLSAIDTNSHSSVSIPCVQDSFDNAMNLEEVSRDQSIDQHKDKNEIGSLLGNNLENVERLHLSTFRTIQEEENATSPKIEAMDHEELSPAPLTQADIIEMKLTVKSDEEKMQIEDGTKLTSKTEDKNSVPHSPVNGTLSAHLSNQTDDEDSVVMAQREADKDVTSETNKVVQTKNLQSRDSTAISERTESDVQNGVTDNSDGEM